MNILVFGQEGQVGFELQRALAPLGTLIILNQKTANFTDLTCLRQHIDTHKPEIIVNAAAYTAVDKAESEPELADQINHKAVAEIAKAAKSHNSLLIHYSTDYVYPGDGVAPRDETAITGPLGVYGASKLAGDEAIIATGGRYIILRTSWVYAARGHNFIKTMIKLSKEREALTVIDDQVGSPTGAELIADVSAHIIKQTVHQEIQEVYHLVASGYTSWYEFTQYIIQCLKEKNIPLKVTTLAPIETKAYPTPATRPLNSRLLINKIEQDFNLTLPHWKLGVKRVINELIEQQ